MNNFYVKVASYKNSKSFFWKVIRIKQRYILKLPKRFARYSHTELVFCYTDDKDILQKIKQIENIQKSKELFVRKNLAWYEKADLDWYFKKYWLWFSSSEEDWWVRFKFIADDKNHWNYKKIKVSKEEYIKMLDFAISQEWNAYNWLWIFWDQALWVKWFRMKWDWFCCQIVIATLQQIWKLCWINAVDYTPWQTARDL